MAKTDENGFWLSARGKATPPEFIDPVVKKRDAIVEMIVRRAEKLQERMQKDKEWMLSKIDDFIAYEENKTGEKRKGKGNLQLTNYSGDQQVQFNLNDIIEFDDRLQIAKGVIDRCLHKWSDGAHKNLKAIVDEAFEVDKKGSVNKMAILRLRAIKINDEDWNKAMELIGDSITIAGTRQYLNVFTRPNGNDKFTPINLTFSSL